jgi:malate dehydrogenase
MPVVGEAEVREAIRRGRRKLVVSEDALLTPQALESAEALGVEIQRGAVQPSPVGTDPARAIRRTLLRRNPRWVAPSAHRGLTPTRFGRLGFIGAGGVGATTAHLAACADMADEIVMIDIVPDVAAAVALDLEHASGITGARTSGRGGTGMELVAGCDAIVITAGRPRTPGMDRSALLEVNGGVIRSAAEAVAQYAPEAIVIVVTNPLDEMTHEFWAASGLEPRRVIGMAGTLDSSRFRHEIARAAEAQAADVEAITLGSHGAEMVPVTSTATVRGRPLVDVLPAAEIERCVKRTIDGGAAVVRLRRTGSAIYAPAHATLELLDAIRGAKAGPVPVSAMLAGEYGIDGVFLGVPAVLGRDGVIEVVEQNLAAGELESLRSAALAIRARLGLD